MTREISCDEPRNLQNHRNGVLNLKDVADHWIGFPKSPYTNTFTVTAHPNTPSTIPPTSSPLSVNKVLKKKKSKSRKSSYKRRYDDYDRPSYKDIYKDNFKNTDQLDYDDFSDYNYNGLGGPMVQNPYAPSQYFFKASSAAPKTVYANPSAGSGSQTLNAIYASPKVATYVIPDAKKYVVQRVKSHSIYSSPAASSPDLYTAASNTGIRRIDPLDYDDGVGGRNSFLNLSPQDSFPPRPVMNKIAQPGQSQPCHGPDCHQHHKGLVRFYWRRVVYPPGTRGRGRARSRQPPRGGRRRLRGSSRAPSDQKDVYYTEGEEDDTQVDDNNAEENNDDTDDDDEEEEEDNEDDNTKRRNVWQPNKGYGHDLSEGSNYDDQDMKTYRDKRYAYKKRMKRRYQKQREPYEYA